MNLVPNKSGTTPSYWCTWGIQNFSLLNTTIKDADDFAKNGFRYAMDNLSEELLFENPGWASHYFDPVRSDLYLLFDVGWDTQPGLNYPQARYQLGSVEVDSTKFPSCSEMPVERLTKLNEIVKAAGWRGAALWISPQVPGDEQETGKLRQGIDVEEYWRERARWSLAAGIEYWKVDIGARGLVAGFRQMMTRIAHEEAPGLFVEHGRNTGPLNDVPVPWEEVACQKQGRFHTWGQIYPDSVNLLNDSDIFRTYDVTAHLTVATTLDRVASLLEASQKQMRPNRLGLLNVEDEPYIAAVLGCTMGIMRHPLWQHRPDMDYDPASYHRRIDEVVRAIHWQRLAPAFGAAETGITLDETVLTDSWKFSRGETWADFVVGKTIQQSAPARVARGTRLPQVETNTDLLPYVVTSRHPNGAISVATLPRTLSDKISHHIPPATITITAGDTFQPIGIFGHYATLSIEFNQSILNKQIWAQDLAGNEAIDISQKVEINQNKLILEGELIEQVGLMAASSGDLSDPGLVIVLV